MSQSCPLVPASPVRSNGSVEHNMHKATCVPCTGPWLDGLASGWPCTLPPGCRGPCGDPGAPPSPPVRWASWGGVSFSSCPPLACPCTSPSPALVTTSPSSVPAPVSAPCPVDAAPGTGPVTPGDGTLLGRGPVVRELRWECMRDSRRVDPTPNRGVMVGVGTRAVALVERPRGAACSHHSPASETVAETAAARVVVDVEAVPTLPDALPRRWSLP
jgi:hypothetical protein